MSDAEIRRLEKLARTDPAARVQLAHARLRAGLVEPVPPQEASISLLFTGQSDYFGGHHVESGESMLLFARPGLGATLADVLEEWLSDFNDQASDECYGWEQEHPDHNVLSREEPDNPAWQAPLLHLTNDQITLAFISNLRQDLQSAPLNQIPFEGLELGDLVDADCETCGGSGLVDGEHCECVEGALEDNQFSVIALLSAVSVEQDDE